MPLIHVNADADRPVLCGGGCIATELADALAALPPGAPVVVLLHGYKFSPWHPRRNPHHHILSLSPRAGCWKAVSWPRHLGFGKGAAQEGLCIAFGWEARGSIWRAWAEAEAAGRALAALIRLVRKLHAAPVHMLTHSLGARVALQALSHLPAGSIGRAVLLAAAEFQSHAAEALSTPGGSSAEIVNITSRENDPFDKMLELFLCTAQQGDRALGAGLGRPAQNWLDIQIDCDQTRAALADLGFRIPPPSRRICHWSGYLRPGVFGLYAQLIRAPHDLPLTRLAKALPQESAPRWSRLFAALMPPRPGSHYQIRRVLPGHD